MRTIDVVLAFVIFFLGLTVLGANMRINTLVEAYRYERDRAETCEDTLNALEHTQR